MSDTSQDVSGEYKKIFGKKPFHGWTDDEILAKVEEAKKGGGGGQVSSWGDEAMDKDGGLSDESTNAPRGGGLLGTETITMNKDELSAMIRREVEAAKNEERRRFESDKQTIFEGWREIKEDKKENNEASLRMYRKDGNSPKGIIVDMKFFENVWDPYHPDRIKDQIYEFTIQYDGGKTEKIQMPYIRLLDIQEREVVKILERKTKLLERVTGRVERSARTKDGYVLSKSLGGEEQRIKVSNSVIVDQKEIVEVSEVLIQRPNGEKFWIQQSKLNN